MKGVQNEKEILEGFAKGDNKIIKKFLDDHYDEIRRYIIGKGAKAHEVDEFIQEGLIVLYDIATKKNINIKGRVIDYFFGIIKILFFRHLKNNPDRIISIEDGNEIFDEIDIEYYIIQNEKYKLYETILQQLDNDCKKLFELIHSGVETKKILKKMKYSIQYFYKKRSLCKKELIEKIKKDIRYKELMDDIEI